MECSHNNSSPHDQWPSHSCTWTTPSPLIDRYGLIRMIQLFPRRWNSVCLKCSWETFHADIIGTAHSLLVLFELLTSWLLARMHHFNSSKDCAVSLTHFNHRLPCCSVHPSQSTTGRVRPVQKFSQDTDASGSEWVERNGDGGCSASSIHPHGLQTECAAIGPEDGERGEVQGHGSDAAAQVTYDHLSPLSINTHSLYATSLSVHPEDPPIAAHELYFNCSH